MSVKYSKAMHMKQMLPQTSLLGCPQTTVITKEGLSMNVPSILLKMFSSHLTTILSLPPCVSTAIILPDFTLSTLSNLVEILSKGFSAQCKDILESKDTMEKVLGLAKAMGLTVDKLDFGLKQVKCVEDIKQDLIKHSAEKAKDALNDERHEKLIGEMSESNPEKLSKEQIKLVPRIIKGKKENKPVEISVEHFVERPISNAISENQKNNHQNLSNDKTQDLNNAEDVSAKTEQVKPCKKKRVRFVGKRNESKPRFQKHKKMPESVLDETLKADDKENQLNKHEYTSSLKILSECQICKRSFDQKGFMIQHLVTSHFHKEVREKYANLHDGSKCLICDKDIKKNNMALHIGATHRKVNEILREKGLKPVQLKLKCSQVGKLIRGESKPRFRKYKKLPKIVLDENLMTDSVKFFLECEVCKRSYDNGPRMLQHMVISHFHKELREQYGNLHEGSKCLICDKIIKKSNMTLHIGATHRKVNEVLREKGLKPVQITKFKKGSTAPIIKLEIKNEEELSDQQIEHVGEQYSSISKEILEEIFVENQPRSIDQIIAKYAIN